MDAEAVQVNRGHGHIRAEVAVVGGGEGVEVLRHFVDREVVVVRAMSSLPSRHTTLSRL